MLAVPVAGDVVAVAVAVTVAITVAVAVAVAVTVAVAVAVAVVGVWLLMCWEVTSRLHSCRRWAWPRPGWAGWASWSPWAALQAAAPIGYYRTYSSRCQKLQ